MQRLNLKKAFIQLMLGFAIYATHVEASDEQRDDSKDCCFNFDLSVDLLIWKPCVDDLDFAATSFGNFSDVDNPRQINYRGICPSWEPGFRVGLRKEEAWKCFNLDFMYTWYQSQDSASAHGESGKRIAATLLPPRFIDLKSTFSDDTFFDTGKGKWNLDYQAFDILFSYPLQLCQSNIFSPFFGVSLLKMNQQIRGEYIDSEVDSEESFITVNTLARSKWKSDYKAAGLKIGSCYSFEICKGLNLFAAGSACLLIGHSDTNSRFSFFQERRFGPTIPEVETETAYMKVKDDDCCHFVPEFNIKAGFTYEGNMCECDWTLRVGYEFIMWQNMPTYRRFHDIETGLIADSNRVNVGTIGFHGLTVGLGLSY